MTHKLSSTSALFFLGIYIACLCQQHSIIFIWRCMFYTFDVTCIWHNHFSDYTLLIYFVFWIYMIITILSMHHTTRGFVSILKFEICVLFFLIRRYTTSLTSMIFMSIPSLQVVIQNMTHMSSDHTRLTWPIEGIVLASCKGILISHHKDPYLQ